MNYYIQTNKENNTTYLTHHGIQGQKWGIKNGPPYPLDKQTVKNIKKANAIATVSISAAASIVATVAAGPVAGLVSGVSTLAVNAIIDKVRNKRLDAKLVEDSKKVTNVVNTHQKNTNYFNSLISGVKSGTEDKDDVRAQISESYHDGEMTKTEYDSFMKKLS